MLYFFLSVFSAIFVDYSYSRVISNSSAEADFNDTVYSHGSEVSCKLQPNGYECNGKLTHKFYYDIKMEDCITAPVGSCLYHELNSFNTLNSCQDSCREEGEHDMPKNMSARVYCRLQPDFGKCHSYHSMWYFDVTHRECRGFAYSGCGGNLNRFATSQLCSAACMAAVLYKKPPPEDKS